MEKRDPDQHKSRRPIQEHFAFACALSLPLIKHTNQEIWEQKPRSTQIQTTHSTTPHARMCPFTITQRPCPCRLPASFSSISKHSCTAATWCWALRPGQVATNWLYCAWPIAISGPTNNKYRWHAPFQNYSTHRLLPVSSVPDHSDTAVARCYSMLGWVLWLDDVGTNDTEYYPRTDWHTIRLLPLHYRHHHFLPLPTYLLPTYLLPTITSYCSYYYYYCYTFTNVWFLFDIALYSRISTYLYLTYIISDSHLQNWSLDTYINHQLSLLEISMVEEKAFALNFRLACSQIKRVNIICNATILRRPRSDTLTIIALHHPVCLQYLWRTHSI